MLMLRLLLFRRSGILGGVVSCWPELQEKHVARINLMSNRPISDFKEPLLISLFQETLPLNGSNL